MRRPPVLLAVLGAVAALAGIAACVEVVALGKACETDAECGSEYRCAPGEQVCVPAGALAHDAGPDDDEDAGRDDDDAGRRVDAGAPRTDAGSADAGRVDAGATDAGDAGPDDAGLADAGFLDAGPVPDGGFDDAGLPVCPQTPAPTGCFSIDVGLVVVERGETVCVDVAALCDGACTADAVTGSVEGLAASAIGGAQVQLVVAAADAAPAALDVVPLAVSTAGADVLLEVVVVDAADYDVRYVGGGPDSLSPSSWCPALDPTGLRAFVPRGALHGFSVAAGRPLSLTSLHVATGSGVVGESALTLADTLEVRCDFFVGGGRLTMPSPGSVHADGCDAAVQRFGGTLPRIRVVVGVQAALYGGLRTLSSARFGRPLPDASDPGEEPARVDLRGRTVASGSDLEVRDAILTAGAGAVLLVEDDVELRGPFASTFAVAEVQLGGDVMIDATAATFSVEAVVAMVDNGQGDGQVQSDAQLPDLLVGADHVVHVDGTGTGRTVTVGGDVVVHGRLRVNTGDTLQVLGDLDVRGQGRVEIESGATMDVDGAATFGPDTTCTGNGTQGQLNAPLCPLVTPI